MLKQFYLIILLGLLFVSCEKAVNKSSSSTNPATIPTPTADPTPTPGNQISPPYVFSKITAHGNSGGIAQWSSATDPGLLSSQGLFVTDSRLKVRVKAKSSPGKVISDTYGNECTNYPMNYTKLQVTMGVKRFNGPSYLETHVFDNISVNSYSDVHSFSVPPNSISEPYKLEVYDVKWDWTCQVWFNGTHDSLCPWDYVWTPDCFEIDVEMSTDYTGDL